MRVAVKSWKLTLQYLKSAKLDFKNFSRDSDKMSEDRTKYKKKMQEIKKTHSEFQVQKKRKLKEIRGVAKKNFFQNDLRDCNIWNQSWIMGKFLGRLNQNNQIQLDEERKNLEFKKERLQEKEKKN